MQVVRTPSDRHSACVPRDGFGRTADPTSWDFPAETDMVIVVDLLGVYGQPDS
jgi:hypothetical protein